MVNSFTKKILFIRSFMKSKGIIIFILLILGIFSSCIKDDLGIGTELIDVESESITIKANISASENNSRTYYGSDEVEQISSGDFYLMYPMNEGYNWEYSRYGRAKVSFGNPEDPTTGYISFEKDGKTKDLKWKNIVGEGSNQVYFFMNNIDPDCYSIYNYNVGNSSYKTYYYLQYQFNDKSPYYASPLDKTNGSNDLISSGSSSLTSNGYVNASIKIVNNSPNKSIPVQLFHRMAMIKLDINLYDDGEGYFIDLSRASVKITNLYRKLNTFNLYYCTNSSFKKDVDVSYNTYSDREKPIVMVGETDNGEIYNWDEETFNNEIHLDENGNQFKIYKVQDFIVPPQTLTFSVQYTPEIIVTVPKEDVTQDPNDKGSFIEYKGYLPSVMYSANASGETTSMTPLATTLTSGYVLHLTAFINSPNTELYFAPAKVENWVNKSSFTIKTKQSGIYNKNDFYNLIKCYEEKDLEGLLKYGYKSGDTFYFQFWASMTLDKEAIENSMTHSSDLPFTFLFNDFSIIVEDNGEKTALSGLEGQNILYGIVTGQTVSTIDGINSIGALTNLLSLCRPSDNYKTPDINALSQYGTLSNYENQWTFELKTNLEVDIEDIFKKIDPTFLGNKFTINYGDYSIKVRLNDSMEIITDKNSEIDKFSRMAGNALTGISSPEDFYFLVECYNNYYSAYPSLLSLYGTETTSWKFTFLNAMTLEGERSFVSMVPDAANDKPSYSISTSYTINFSSDIVPVSTNNKDYIYSVLSGTGKSTGQTSLSNIVSYYNNSSYNNSNYYYLWYYGRFDFDNNEWIFPLDYYSGTQYISYSSLFNKMKPDGSAGKYNYKFYLGNKTFEVRNMPNDEESPNVSTHYFYQNITGNPSYPNSAEDLKRVADGTYWEYFKEWQENHPIDQNP